MNRFRKQGRDGEYNFWQPATDLMTGLVFILMLLVALLGLYLLYTPSLFDAMEPSTEALAEEQGDVPETGGYGELEGDGADEEEGDGYGDGEDNEEGDDDGKRRLWPGRRRREISGSRRADRWGDKADREGGECEI